MDMRLIGIILRWAGTSILVVILFGALWFGAIESYLFFTRSEAKARVAAQEQFVKLCDEYKLEFISRA
jgi:hypothetical protein